MTFRSALKQYQPDLVYPSTKTKLFHYIHPKDALVIEEEETNEEEDEIKLRVGPVIDGTEEQELITIQRFSSRRLGIH